MWFCLYMEQVQRLSKENDGEGDINPVQEAASPQKDRIKHIMDMAAEKGMTMTQEAAILLDEWIEDPEEMATEIEKLLLAESKTVTLDLVKELSKDEGSRALFRLLDDLCFKDEKL